MAPVFARWLNTVCLGLWLGGLIAVGALTAPSAFHVARTTAALAGNPALQTSIAAGIVGDTLRKFNDLCDICGVLLIIANGILLIGAKTLPQGRRFTLGGTALIVLATVVTLYLQFGLFPSLDAAQGQGNKPLFDLLHHRYESLSKAQFPILLVVALLTAMRDTPRHLAKQGVDASAK